MNRSSAIEILEEARQDTRITAEIDTRYVRNGNGHRVLLILKKDQNDQRSILLRHSEDWQVVKLAWKNL